MTDRIGSSQSTPKPQATKTAPIPQQATPTAVAEKKPKLSGDSAALSSAATGQIEAGTTAKPAAKPTSDAPGNGTLDNGSIGVGIQTFLQGIPRAIGQIGGKILSGAGKVLGPAGKVFARANKGVLAAADILDGNNRTVGKTVGRVIGWTRNVAPRLFGQNADKVLKVTTPAVRGAGTVARALGKAAPVLNVLVAGYDTYKAASETDPAKKTGAWANAGLSIGGTAMAVGAVVVGASPVGWALGAGAAVVAGFQLVDSLAFEGKGTKWIGEKAAAAGSAIAGAAKGAWNAITSL